MRFIILGAWVGLAAGAVIGGWIGYNAGAQATWGLVTHRINARERE
jgi:hypothetical protein